MTNARACPSGPDLSPFTFHPLRPNPPYPPSASIVQRLTPTGAPMPRTSGKSVRPHPPLSLAAVVALLALVPLAARAHAQTPPHAAEPGPPAASPASRIARNVSLHMEMSPRVVATRDDS